ncbi:MAG: Oligopeptide transport system permease protein OppB [Chlamydiia bacterium]|nr:Oligopeptide transport system permease protein OppB [Chlamydiia bacterium]
MKAIPGDPFMQEQAVPEEIMQSMRAYYGLDQPLHVQYVRYLKGLCTFDLGPSFKYEGRTITKVIKEGFPVSLSLGSLSLSFSIVVGISLGITSAIFHGKWQDKSILLLVIYAMSVPSFILSTFLQYWLALRFGWLPIARWGTFAHMVIPAISLAALPTAFITRLTRNNVIEVLKKDYVLMAYAKGLSTCQVVIRHVIKNSLLPVISYISSLAATILTGSFVVEKIFGIPGLGGCFVNSITNRDYTMILGITVFYSFLLMLFVFVADIIYFIIDPRIKNKVLTGQKNA